MPEQMLHSSPCEIEATKGLLLDPLHKLGQTHKPG
jgi:hypothetical protein